MSSKIIGLLGTIALLIGFIILGIKANRDARLIARLKTSAYKYAGTTDPLFEDDDFFKSHLSEFANGIRRQIGTMAGDSKKVAAILKRTWPGLDTAELDNIEPVLSAYIDEALFGEIDASTRDALERALAVVDNWQLDAAHGPNPSADTAQSIVAWQQDITGLLETAEYIGKRQAALRANAAIRV